MGLTARNLVATGAILVLAAVSGSVAVAAGHSAGRSRTYSTPATARLATAVADPPLFGGQERAGALARTRSAGASYVRLGVFWGKVAPSTRRAGFNAADPTSPGYTWSGIDATVKAAQAVGLTPILNIVGPTPHWAIATPRSGIKFGGSPKAAELGKFAHALALHYAGGTGLPAVGIYEVWNEPNLSLDLSPASASTYRKMVNAVADGVHSVDPANLVVAGELDPFGHPQSTKSDWYSVYPFAFMRSLLCLSKGAHPHPTCSHEIHFDVWGHHPYTIGGPFQRGKFADDAELGDLPRMRALLNAGVRLHHIVSSHPVQFWVTEFGWDTKPPRSRAAPVSLASRWAGESMYQAWRSGVTLFTWFDLEDQASGPYRSGLYFHASSLSRAQPKPVLTAFRFPFVAYRHRSTVSVWGRDKTSDRQRVTIQLRPGTKGKWRTVADVVANSNGIYLATLKLKTSTNDWLRAVAPGSGKSLAFSLTVPHHPHIGPWGS